MNRKNVKIAINIDSELNEIFKSSMNVHGKTYQNVLEEEMRLILHEMPDYITHRLKELDQERDQLLKLKAKSKNID